MAAANKITAKPNNILILSRSSIYLKDLTDLELEIADGDLADRQNSTAHDL